MIEVEKQAKGSGPSRPFPSLRVFHRNTTGASAVEFAIVATPFLLTLLAVIEVAVVFFATFALEGATNQGARLIRTGQAQTQSFDAGRFKTEVCKYIVAPITCAGLKLDVRHYTSFADAASNLTNPLDAQGNLKSNFSFDPGNSGDVVVVRAFYEWPVAAKLPKPIGLSNMKNGDRLLMATAAFRNEPYK